AADASPPDDPRGALPTRREFVVGVGAGAATAAMLGSRTAAADPAAPIYRIHPAIGIARHGNPDASTFFIGPEIPGMGPLNDRASPGTAVPPYKADQATLVKPQAARFRIWEYRWVNGRLTPIREVNLDTPGVAAITWTVHIANKKSSFYSEANEGG